MIVMLLAALAGSGRQGLGIGTRSLEIHAGRLSGTPRWFENSLGLLLIYQNTLVDEGPRKQASSLSLQPAHMVLL